MKNEKLKVLDLFSGIGGFSLGLERTGGFETVAFCEIEDFPRKVLRKHWPDVPIFEDVRELTGEQVGSVDVICGGFPCQDISRAGSGEGLDGSRSGLWSEYARLIGEIRPQFVIVENVAALLHRGLNRVLGDLAEIGYDTEWHCIPAANIGAPHIRDRIWIIAYPQYSDTDSIGSHRAEEHNGSTEPGNKQGSFSRSMGEILADPNGFRQLQQKGGEQNKRRRISYCGRWIPEPSVGRVAHGVPRRVDRLKSLGNAVVPQIPEIIGMAILEAEYSSIKGDQA